MEQKQLRKFPELTLRNKWSLKIIITVPLKLKATTARSFLRVCYSYQGESVFLVKNRSFLCRQSFCYEFKMTDGLLDCKNNRIEFTSS